MTRWRRRLLVNSSNIAGAVYGSVLTASIVTVAAGDASLGLWKMAALVGATVFVYWLAHVYAHTMGETMRSGERLSFTAVRAVGRNEWPLLQSAALPLAAIALGALEVLDRGTALWFATTLPVATLFGFGVLYARRERMGRLGTLVVASITAMFGMVVVGLKVSLAH